MSGRYELYGAPGWGSTLTELMLAWCGADYEFIDVEGFDAPGEARQRLLALNPLAQVPTLALPSGEVMTESAAIALLLSETFPEAGLAPPPGSAGRARFLRLLVWMVAAVYPTFTFADYPDKWAPEAGEMFVERVDGHKRELWRQFEADLGEGPWKDGPWALGEAFSALDIYVACMVRWRPRPVWFAARAPRMFAIAKRVELEDVLRPVILRNFGGLLEG